MAQRTSGLSTSSSAETAAALKHDLLQVVRIPVLLAALLVGIEVVNALTLHAFNAFGVVPRTLPGLVGLVTMPFLHGSFGHVIGNATSLLLFGSLLLLLCSRRIFWGVTVATALGGGVFAWVFGDSGSHHVGYSGVLFGYFGFLLALGFAERRVGSVLFSLAVGALWGGMVFGVLPGQSGISWEGHLGGFLAGVAAALVVGRARRRAR